jgi:hypothetical protein
MPGTLKLLAPWNLQPSEEESISDEDRLTLRGVLLDLQEALKGELDQAIPRLAKAIESIRGVPCSPIFGHDAAPEHSQAVVKDYDEYFQIEHVESSKPALCHALSLAESVYAFLDCSQGLPQSNEREIDLQKKGFLCHVRLLQRAYLKEEQP